MRIVENNMNSINIINTCTETMENINSTISSICIEHINQRNNNSSIFQRRRNIRQNNARQNNTRQNNTWLSNIRQNNNTAQNNIIRTSENYNTNQQRRYWMNSGEINNLFDNISRRTTTRRTTFDPSFSEVPMTITYREYPLRTVRRYPNIRNISRGLTIPQIIENTTIINVNDISNNTQGNCPISMKPLTSLTSVTKINVCGHMFSTVDLYTWLSENNDCPICRCKAVQNRRTVQANTEINRRLDISNVPVLDINNVPVLDISNVPVLDISNVPVLDISNVPVLDISNVPVLDISNNIIETDEDTDLDSDEEVIQQEIQSAINNIAQTLIDNLPSDMTDLSNNEILIDASIYMD